MSNKLEDNLIIRGNNIYLKDTELHIDFTEGDDAVINLLGAILYEKIAAKNDTRKDYRLHSVYVSLKTFNKVIERFNLDNNKVLKVFGVFVEENEKDDDYVDDYVEYHYTWTMFEMGKE